MTECGYSTPAPIHGHCNNTPITIHVKHVTHAQGHKNQHILYRVDTLPRQYNMYIRCIYIMYHACMQVVKLLYYRDMSVLDDERCKNSDWP